MSSQDVGPDPVAEAWELEHAVEPRYQIRRVPSRVGANQLCEESVALTNILLPSAVHYSSRGPCDNGSFPFKKNGLRDGSLFVAISGNDPGK